MKKVFVKSAFLHCLLLLSVTSFCQTSDQGKQETEPLFGFDEQELELTRKGGTAFGFHGGAMHNRLRPSKDDYVSRWVSVSVERFVKDRFSLRLAGSYETFSRSAADNAATEYERFYTARMSVRYYALHDYAIGNVFFGSGMEYGWSGDGAAESSLPDNIWRIDPLFIGTSFPIGALIDMRQLRAEAWAGTRYDNVQNHLYYHFNGGFNYRF